MIPLDDLGRIMDYAAATDLSLPFFFPDPKHSNDGATQGAPGGSIVSGAEGTNNTNYNESHAGIFGPAPTPMQYPSNRGISSYSKFLVTYSLL
jgi:hypothetical protein